MDPTACFKRWQSSVAEKDLVEALGAYYDLMRWLERKGFEPSWTEEEQQAFLMWSPWNDSKDHEGRSTDTGRPRYRRA